MSFINILEAANIRMPADWRRTMATRLERIKKEGSEPFTWKPPATAAGATVQIEIATQFPRARKYQPLDTIEITNNDAVDLTLIVNENIRLPVPAGTIRTIRNQALWQVGLTNDDAAVTSVLDKIVITVSRAAETIDSYARRKG